MCFIFPCLYSLYNLTISSELSAIKGQCETIGSPVGFPEYITKRTPSSRDVNFNSLSSSCVFPALFFFISPLSNIPFIVWKELFVCSRIRRNVAATALTQHYYSSEFNWTIV